MFKSLDTLKQRPLLMALLLLCLFTAWFARALAEEPLPRPQGAVNDFANVIPADKRDRMENLAREVLEKTGAALVVATVPTIGDDEVNGYVNRLYSAWGIGRKGEDRGVLIFVTVKERRMRIETGYGVEGVLPDGLVGQIRDRHMVPFLRQGDYGQGLLNGMTAIASILAREANVTLTGVPSPDRSQMQRPVRRGLNPLVIVAVVLFVLFLVGTRPGRELLPVLLAMLLSGGGRGGSMGGGGFGGFGGGFGGFGGGSSGGGGAGGSF